MPAVTARHGSRRRTMNEINMVPFIDVMLVLLIIFMVTAPLITTGVVDLPSVGKAKQGPEDRIDIVVGSDERLRLKSGKQEYASVTLAQLAARVKQGQGGNAQMPVLIQGDKNVKYEAVVKVMDTLQRAGVQRIALSVQQGAP
jgi:biopolymer transport protein TolR